MIYDSIVIGHGPAGLTAAIYLKRANKSVLTVGKDLGVLENKSIQIENYFGFKKVSGSLISMNSFEHAKELGCEVVTDEVLKIEFSNDVFIVTTIENIFSSKTLIIAAGQKRTSLKIPGLNSYIGKGVSFCATCDGFFYRDKKIALIGNSKYMLHELKDLSSITNDITIFTNGEKLFEAVKYPIVDEKIISISGDDTHAKSLITSNATYNVDGIFVAYDFAGGLELAKKIGILVDKSEIVVNEYGETNIKGIFAAGDIIKGRKQITKATYDGMNAAHGVIDYLYKLNNK